MCIYVYLYVRGMYEMYLRNVCMCMYVITYIYVFTYMYIHLQSFIETKHQFEMFSLSWNHSCYSRAAHVECVVDKVTLGPGFPESFGFRLSVSF